jgi:hypothetical protein
VTADVDVGITINISDSGKITISMSPYFYRLAGRNGSWLGLQQQAATKAEFLEAISGPQVGFVEVTTSGRNELVGTPDLIREIIGA